MLKIINEFFRIIWLSVSSVAFYRDLYNKYQGYGLKYITMVISITSIIYALLFMYNLNVMKKYLIQDTAGDDNPVEFILKDWPILQYDGKIITSEDATPIYLTNEKGVKLAAIDPAGNLTKEQIHKVPLVLKKDKVILLLRSGAKNAQQEISNWTFRYDEIFDKEPKVIDHNFIKSFILDKINKVGPVAFCIALPIFILLRIIWHIQNHLFHIGFLYIILWWAKMKPDIKAVSRIIFFTSSAAELVTPFILVTYPPLLLITIFIELWAIMLAVYAIVSKKK